MGTFNAELGLNKVTKLLFRDSKSVLDIFAEDVLVEELLQSLGQHIVNKLVSGDHSFLGVLELFEGLELNNFVGSFFILEGFDDIGGFFEFSFIEDLEKGESSWCFEEKQHFLGRKLGAVGVSRELF